MTTAQARVNSERAVKRGVKWLDANVPNWRARIDVASLDLQFPCKCVLGQLDGNFYEAVWTYRLERSEVSHLGFLASTRLGTTYRWLNAAWRRALKEKK